MGEGNETSDVRAVYAGYTLHCVAPACRMDGRLAGCRCGSPFYFGHLLLECGGAWEVICGTKGKRRKKQMRPTPKEEMKDAETQGRSEEEVWAQTEAEGEWIKRMLSHNMRMPMAIITGYGDLLKTGEYQNRQEELLSLIHI